MWHWNGFAAHAFGTLEPCILDCVLRRRFALVKPETGASRVMLKTTGLVDRRAESATASLMIDPYIAESGTRNASGRLVRGPGNTQIA